MNIKKLLVTAALLFAGMQSAEAQTSNPATRAWVSANYCALAGCTYTGAVAGTTLALGGATIGSNALAVTGTSLFGNVTIKTNTITSANNLYLGGGGTDDLFSIGDNNNTIKAVALGVYGWSADSTSFGTLDTILARNAAANIRLGAAAVDTAPVAQTLSVQSVLAGGTSNVAGANFTIAGSQGKGTGVGGSLIFQVAPAGSTGTAVNALVNQMVLAPVNGLSLGYGTLSSAPYVTFSNSSIGTGTPLMQINNGGGGSSNNVSMTERNNGNVVSTWYYGAGTGQGDFGVGTGASIATTATAGFLLIPGGAGAPSGVPVNAGAGKNPLYYDQTNNQLYIYNGGWKQPKTPAGAATVTWQ